MGTDTKDAPEQDVLYICNPIGDSPQHGTLDAAWAEARERHAAGEASVRIFQMSLAGIVTN